MSVTYLMPYVFPMRPRRLASTILAEVCERHGIAPEVITGRSRRQCHTIPRHEFFYLALSLSPLSAVSIGERYGFNHASVLYGAARHAQRNDLPPVTAMNLVCRQGRARAAAFARWRAMRSAAE